MLRITDNAEGMTEKTLEKIFSIYGDDNAGGVVSGARGIFGQGASDVLRSAAQYEKEASIVTIKDGKVTRLLYRLDENYNPSIDITSIVDEDINSLGESLRIEENGTSLTFGVPDNVKFSAKIRDNLSMMIQRCPSLRYILSDDNRQVIFIERGFEYPLSSKKYLFSKDKLISSDTKIKFKFEGDEVKCELRLYTNNTKEEDGTHILVRDENYLVFDNTMFDFQYSPASKNVSGELIIEGLYNICYKHLNSSEPTSIIRDNRTGFDTKHPFYEALLKTLAPILEKNFEKNDKSARITDVTNNKKFNDALKKLNKYLNSELQNEIGGNLNGLKVPPSTGLKFVRASATITKGKTYMLKLLINSSMIPSSEQIDIRMEDNDFIEVSPLTINYKEDESKQGIVEKNISIKALKCTDKPITIIASALKYSSQIDIEVINEEIHYPQNGMEFFPNEIDLQYDRTHVVRLYLDSTIIPIGSEIEINCEGLDLLYHSYEFTENDLISNSIGKIDIISEGGELNETYSIEAKWKSINAVAKITLVEVAKNDPLGGGLIAGIELKEEMSHFQTRFDNRTKKIIINTLNPINIKMLGSLKEYDQLNPVFNKDQSKYLCDLVSKEGALLFARKKYIQEWSIKNCTDELIDEIENKIQEQKNIIYESMYPVLVRTKK